MNELFKSFVDNALKIQKELYLLGDFNRDLLNEQIKKTMARIFRAIWPHTESKSSYQKNI